MRLCSVCNQLKDEKEYYFESDECIKCAYERKSGLVSPAARDPKEVGCLMCGREIERGRDKYCSAACLKRSQNEKSKAWYKRNVPR